MPFDKAATLAILPTVAAAMLVVTLAAEAQSPRSAIAPAPVPPNVREVFLVRQDQSDCSNSTVPAGDSPNVQGTLMITKGTDGNTTVKVAMTVSPNTKYHFYLKCVRQLGDIVTGDEGTGFATFTFPSNAVGSTFAFDMYPDGAPSGNKFQSATVNF